MPTRQPPKNNDELKAGAEDKLDPKDFEHEEGITDGEDEGHEDPQPKKGAKSGKKIEVDSGLLEMLVEQNKEMAKKLDKLESNAVAQTPQNVHVRKIIKDRDYFIRKWDNKFVTGFENVGNERRPTYVYSIFNNDQKKHEQFVNLIFFGSNEKAVKIPYMDFLRDSERIKVRQIGKPVEHESVQEFGYIPKKEMAENGYGQFETMVMVPVEVTSKNYTVTVKVPEDDEDFAGREITLEDTWLNM